MAGERVYTEAEVRRMWGVLHDNPRIAGQIDALPSAPLPAKDIQTIGRDYELRLLNYALLSKPDSERFPTIRQLQKAALYGLGLMPNYDRTNNMTPQLHAANNVLWAAYSPQMTEYLIRQADAAYPNYQGSGVGAGTKHAELIKHIMTIGGGRGHLVVGESNHAAPQMHEVFANPAVARALQLAGFSAFPMEWLTPDQTAASNLQDKLLTELTKGGFNVNDPEWWKKPLPENAIKLAEIITRDMAQGYYPDDKAAQDRFTQAAARAMLNQAVVGRFIGYDANRDKLLSDPRAFKALSAIYGVSSSPDAIASALDEQVASIIYPKEMKQFTKLFADRIGNPANDREGARIAMDSSGGRVNRMLVIAGGLHTMGYGDTDLDGMLRKLSADHDMPVHTMILVPNAGERHAQVEHGHNEVPGAFYLVDENRLVTGASADRFMRRTFPDGAHQNIPTKDEHARWVSSLSPDAARMLDEVIAKASRTRHPIADPRIYVNKANTLVDGAPQLNGALQIRGVRDKDKDGVDIGDVVAALPKLKPEQYAQVKDAIGAVVAAASAADPDSAEVRRADELMAKMQQGEPVAPLPGGEKRVLPREQAK